MQTDEQKSGMRVRHRRERALPTRRRLAADINRRVIHEELVERLLAQQMPPVSRRLDEQVFDADSAQGIQQHPGMWGILARHQDDRMTRLTGHQKVFNEVRRIYLCLRV